MIVVFANQKGGVGKSTIAALYANHLSDEGKMVTIVETDVQCSIITKRKSDLRLWSEDDIKYDITYVSLHNYDESSELMDYFHKSMQENPGFTILVDVPGNITESYLTPLFVKADYIVCPYTYQEVALNSTSVFARVIEELRNNFAEMKTKVIFLPNRVNKSVGTAKELELYRFIDSKLSQFGEVAPALYERAELQRFNTVYNTPKQRYETEQTFAFFDTKFMI